MNRKTTVWAFVVTAVVVAACGQHGDTLFVSVPSSHSRIDFVNHVEEDVDFNILSYEYLYNGGGVATGDLNNDGKTDIVLSGNMVPSKVYLNKGELKFEDITAASGFNDRERWKTGVVLADVNGDRLLDIYLCYSGPGTDEARANQLFINQGVKEGIPVFKESAKEYGLDAAGTYSTTASFFDFDRDGDLDMFLVNHADMFFNPFFNTEKLRAKRHPKFGNRLYRNDNGVFADVSEAAGIAGSGLNFGLSVSVSDINKDGWVDIYVTNDYDERDFLYLNNRNGGFREVLTSAAGHLSEFAMGSDIADYNNDMNADVMVLDMLPDDNHRQKLLKGADTYDKYTTRVKHGFHQQQMRNTLQLNNGTDSSGIPILSEVGQLAGVYKTDWSWAPLFADFDNDGWKDLFISNGIFKDITNLDFVKYTSGYSNKFTDEKGDKLEMWELIKKMPSTKLNNYFFRNNGDLTFTNATGEWAADRKDISNGAAYADLDNDGDLDMVINCMNDAAVVLRNEQEKKAAHHYLRIQLEGAEKNTQAIGTRVEIRSASGDQLYEQVTSRGFQSSIDPVIHVGLGNDSIVNELSIFWPTGKTSRLKNIPVDTLLVLSEGTAVVDTAENTIEPTPYLEKMTDRSGIDFKHKQSSFVDFKIAPLLPFQPSKLGAAIASADVDNDGKEDLFIGSNTKQENALFLQKDAGKFVRATNQPWNDKKDRTISSAVFLDVEGDGDNDLYLVSGGADYYFNAKNYQDQLFINDGKGNFVVEEKGLPAETFSGSCVAVADYNKDGLPDIFVGSQVKYGQFPDAPENMLLTNRSSGAAIRFERDVQQNDTSLLRPGMVTDAKWIDVNRDGWPDLVLTGLFMPITVFENNKGQLVNKTKAYGLENTNGWWCKIESGDFNGDGYADLLIGNMGINTSFKATAAEPLTITYSDFNGDGVIDPVLSFYNNGKSYPYFSRDEMFEQMPQLQKKFGRYADYADAAVEDVFSKEQLEKARTLSIYNMHSMALVSDGKGRWEQRVLPMEAQMSMNNGMVIRDLDEDGDEDVLLSGNFYPMRVQAGPMDASIGLVLQNDGKGNFSALNYSQTQIQLRGDIRSMEVLKSDQNDLLIVSAADAPIQVFRFNQTK